MFGLGFEIFHHEQQGLGRGRPAKAMMVDDAAGFYASLERSMLVSRVGCGGKGVWTVCFERWHNSFSLTMPLYSVPSLFDALSNQE